MKLYQYSTEQNLPNNWTHLYLITPTCCKPCNLYVLYRILLAMLNRSCVPNKHNSCSMLTKPNLQMDIYTTENTKTSAHDSDGYLWTTSQHWPKFMSHTKQQVIVINIYKEQSNILTQNYENIRYSEKHSWIQL